MVLAKALRRENVSLNRFGIMEIRTREGNKARNAPRDKIMES